MGAFLTRIRARLSRRSIIICWVSLLVFFLALQVLDAYSYHVSATVSVEGSAPRLVYEFHEKAYFRDSLRAALYPASVHVGERGAFLLRGDAVRLGPGDNLAIVGIDGEVFAFPAPEEVFVRGPRPRPSFFGRPLFGLIRWREDFHVSIDLDALKRLPEYEGEIRPLLERRSPASVPAHDAAE